MKRWVALALVSFIPVLALGQSLAEVAKKERERREKNKQKSVEARTVEENEVKPPQPVTPPPSTAKTEAVPSNQNPKAAIESLLGGKRVEPPTPRTVPTPAANLPPPAPIAPAPSFTLEDRRGRRVSLRDFRGRPVLLDFWATWCGPCRSTMPKVQRLYQQYRGQGLQVVGINIEGKTQGVLDFLDQSGYDFLVLFDSGDWQSGVAQKYKVSSIPRTFLVDKNGSIVYSGHPDRLSESLIEATLQ
jgi:thiol-disulfide isomerase/thioredoxin